MRRFEKISFLQFQKDIDDDKEAYEKYSLPKRMTKESAGYDFVSVCDFTLKPNESKKIPTGIKAEMNEGEVLLLLVRSSMGFRYNVRMCNQVGVIDRDYYNNLENEGHIWIKLQNEGEETYIVKKGDRIAQGIFVSYLTVDQEEDMNKTRTSGLGSTNEEG